MAPTSPVAPAAPAPPVAPATPVAPVKPVAPVAPTAPVAPVAPTSFGLSNSKKLFALTNEPAGDTAADTTLDATFAYVNVVAVGVEATGYVPLNVASTPSITTVSPVVSPCEVAVVSVAILEESCLFVTSNGSTAKM